VRPYYSAPDCDFYVGDVLAVAASLPEKSVHIICTSPPYWALRSYLPAEHPDKVLELGSEPIPDCLGWARGETCSVCYICHMRTVAAALWRVLRDDGSLWVNIGDSYAANGASGGGSPVDVRKAEYGRKGVESDAYRARPNVTEAQRCRRVPIGLKPKDRVGIPERLALALQADGWTWRDTIHLCKVAPMPESVRDRTTQAHEPLFLFTKKARYYFDAEAVKESSVSDHGSGNGYARDARLSYDGRGSDRPYEVSPGRNPRSWMLWHTEPSNLAHYAAYPRFIPSFAIRAGSSEFGVCAVCGSPAERQTDRTPMEIRRTDWGEKAGNRTATSGTMTKAATSRTSGWRSTCNCESSVVPATIFDPFSGSGTTQVVARQLGRRSIYCDLSATYADLAIRRLAGVTPTLPLAAPAERERQARLVES
jgi:DNA modification methylase